MSLNVAKHGGNDDISIYGTGNSIQFDNVKHCKLRRISAMYIPLPDKPGTCGNNIQALGLYSNALSTGQSIKLHQIFIPISSAAITVAPKCGLLKIQK